LLGQLFAYTEVFDMQTRPELLLLQKTMVVVEGVARSLDPELDIWSAAEPIAKEGIATNYGVSGRLRGAGEGAERVGRGGARRPGGRGGARGAAARGGAAAAGATGTRGGVWPPRRPAMTAGRAVPCGSGHWRSPPSQRG